MVDTNITNYMGVGLASGLPSSPNPPSGGIEYYYETDTGLLRLWTGSAWVTIGAATANRPGSGSFSWFNQGSAVLNDITGGPLVIRDTNDSTGGWHCLVKSNPAANFTLTAQIGCQGVTDGSNGPLFGLAAISASGAVLSFATQYNDSSQGNLDVSCSIVNWSNATTYSSAVVKKLAGINNPIWMKLVYVNSSGTFTFSVSLDGLDWDEVGTTTVSAFLSTFASIGFGSYFVNTAATSSVSTRLYNWLGV